MEELKSNSVSGRDYNPVYASASSGDIKAQIELGCMYRDGDRVEQDGNKAVEWLTKAANQGSTKAKFNLGHMYKDGDGIPLNYSKAIEWFTLASEEGDMDSLVWIGILHQRGHGFSQDLSKAAECFSEAASKGDSYGQFNLGALYRDGKGVPQDSQKALELFTLSAEQGNELALEALGELYIAQRDYEKGKEYLRRAGEKGKQSALETLNKIEAVEEKHRIEDSIKKFTCTLCNKQTPWGEKRCSHCNSRVKYAPSWKSAWIGAFVGVATAGYGLTQGASFTETCFAFLLPWLAVLLLAKLIGATRAVSIPW